MPARAGGVQANRVVIRILAKSAKRTVGFNADPCGRHDGSARAVRAWPKIKDHNAVSPGRAPWPSTGRPRAAVAQKPGGSDWIRPMDDGPIAPAPIRKPS